MYSAYKPLMRGSHGYTKQRQECCYFTVTDRQLLSCLLRQPPSLSATFLIAVTDDVTITVRGQCHSSNNNKAYAVFINKSFASSFLNKFLLPVYFNICVFILPLSSFSSLSQTCSGLILDPLQASDSSWPRRPTEVRP